MAIHCTAPFSLFIAGNINFVHSFIIKVPRLSEAFDSVQLCRRDPISGATFMDTSYSRAAFPVSPVGFLICTSNIITGVLAEIP